MKKKVSLSTVLLAAAVLSTVPVAATETTTSSLTTTAATSVTTDTTSTTASTASTSLSTEASTTATTTTVTTTSAATSSQTMGKLNLTLVPNPGGDHFDLTVTTPVVRPKGSSIYLDLITVDQYEYSLNDYNLTEGEPANFNSISVESLEATLGQIPDGIYRIYTYQRNTAALGRTKIAEASLYIKVVNGRIVDFNENRDALTAPETTTSITTSEATTTIAATTSSTATTTTSPVTTTAAATTSQAARTTSQAQTSSKAETTRSKAPTAPVTSSSAKTGSKAPAKTDKEKTLPQTGETNSLLAIVGSGLLAFAAYFGLNRKNKKN